jgi:hypothetical protein
MSPVCQLELTLPRGFSGGVCVEPADGDRYESGPGSGRPRALRGCSRGNVDHRVEPVMTSLGGGGDSPASGGARPVRGLPGSRLHNGRPRV